MSGSREMHQGDVDHPEVIERFEAHLDMADRLARRYSFGGQADDDFVQVARLGLLLASRRFDAELGEFVRFATVTVVGELKKHLRSTGWGVRMPRSLQEDSITVASRTDRLALELGRSPTIGEVADATGFEPARVVEALRARDARFAVSIEGSFLDFERPDDEATAAMVRIALEKLPDDQRRLLAYRLGEGLTQAEIGRLIGISQPQVHRRLAAAMDAMRTLLDDESEGRE